MLYGKLAFGANDLDGHVSGPLTPLSAQTHTHTGHRSLYRLHTTRLRYSILLGNVVVVHRLPY